MTAKLLAAGGADVIITYHVGKDDADQLVGEIRLGGGLCRAIPFDVTRPAETAPELLTGSELLTHVYYFATPHIESNPHEWNDALFLNYCEYFVDGLKRTIDTLYDRWNYCAPQVKVFYPSTIFLDVPEKGLAEYTAAKAVGEEVCQQLDRFSEEIRFFVPRLPRMLTDQTNTIIGTTTNEPLAVMREALLNFARYRRTRSPIHLPRSWRSPLKTAVPLPTVVDSAKPEGERPDRRPAAASPPWVSRMRWHAMPWT